MGILILITFLGYLSALAAALLWNLALHLHSPTSSKATTGSQVDAYGVPTVVVTLVHGTWAGRAAWMRDESPLCSAVRDALPNHTVRFVPFHWSGPNSMSARERSWRMF